MNDDPRETRRRRQPARMRKACRHITFPRFPSARHCTRRKIPHLGCEIRTAALVHQVQDGHCRIARLRKTPAYLDVAPRCRWKTLTEQRYHAAQIMNAPHCGDVSRRAAKPAVTAGNWVVPVDCKAQSVGGPRIVKSRNRNRTAGEELTANRNGRQAWERHTSKHMINAEHVAVVVEERFRSCCQVHGSEHHPDPARIDSVKIDHFADHRAQCCGGDDRLLAEGGKSHSAAPTG